MPSTPKPFSPVRQRIVAVVQRWIHAHNSESGWRVCVHAPFKELFPKTQKNSTAFNGLYADAAVLDAAGVTLGVIRYYEKINNSMSTEVRALIHSAGALCMEISYLDVESTVGFAANSRKCLLPFLRNLKISFSPFAKKVHRVVQKIPKGKVASYACVARLAGKPRNARQVGSIMALNHNSATPCHRVVHANGAAGNYNRGGTLREGQLLKVALLKKEGVQFLPSGYIHCNSSWCA